jgi:alkylation response protein AidB-like acyl-CoA dehydrogenase
MARQQFGPGALEHDEIGARLAQLRAETAAVRAMTYTIASRPADGPPGSEASLMRAFFSQLQQRIRRIALDIIGPDSLELADDDPWIRPYLRSYSTTIAAGTSEIQRNIIAERVLGLPR